MKPRIGITTTPSVLEDRLLEALDRANVTAVVVAGGLPLVLPVLDPADAEAAVGCLDGLLLSGGGDMDPAWYGGHSSPMVDGVDAQRDAWELALVRAGLARGVPILGLCRGAQVVNVSAGGSLVQHLPDVTGLQHCLREQGGTTVHRVRVLEGSRLHAVTGLDLVGVNSLHHQAVGAVGAGLRPVGWAEDGIIEAIEGIDGHRVLGVQWHPELLPHEPGQAILFRWLVEEAGQPRAAPAPGTSVGVSPAQPLLAPAAA